MVLVVMSVVMIIEAHAWTKLKYYKRTRMVSKSLHPNGIFDNNNLAMLKMYCAWN